MLFLTFLVGILSVEQTAVEFQELVVNAADIAIPPVDLHWFFEISIRTEKEIQLELKKNQL